MNRKIWKVVYFVNNSGKSPVKKTIDSLDRKTKIKINMYLTFYIQ